MHFRIGYLVGSSALALATLLDMGGAGANVTISSRATAHMSCRDGICEPTAAKAVLNAGDLEKFLKSFGNVTVQTTGQNGVESEDIIVDAPIASPGGSFLNLFAHNAIAVNAHVTVGKGGQLSGLELVSGSGGELGALSFSPDGRISFDSRSDQFNINGAVAVLVDTLPELISVVNANPEGFYVLSDNYDAANDGTYTSSPITPIFTGFFEALGNSISHVTINAGGGADVGLFAETSNSDTFGIIHNLRLENVSVTATGVAGSVGGLVGVSGGTVSQSSVTGSVIDTSSSEVNGGLAGTVYGSVVSSWSAAAVEGGNVNNATGGLVGENYGSISNSYATGVVTGGGFIGGLVGANEDLTPTISGSFATGDVEIPGGGNGAYGGGLVGSDFGVVTDCYATGSVTDSGAGNQGDALGGLIGLGEDTAGDSYSTGAVTGAGSDEVGGTVGDDDGVFKDVYWDTTSSGNSQGAGNESNPPGITGLTSKQLRSGLPAGFKKSLWKEMSNVNSGFPYLIANPPRK